jgi:hypothetical protein
MVSSAIAVEGSPGVHQGAVDRMLVEKPSSGVVVGQLCCNGNEHGVSVVEHIEGSGVARGAEHAEAVEAHAQRVFDISHVAASVHELKDSIDRGEGFDQIALGERNRTESCDRVHRIVHPIVLLEEVA